VSTGGTQAQDFTYTNTNGTITITGYTGLGGNVTIPSSINGLPVTSIGGYAFQFLFNLTNITIPDSVTNIEDGAYYKGGGMGTFWGCTNLTNATLGQSVTHIGFGAFQGCTSLTAVSIPDSVTTIGDFAFNNCTSVTVVTIGKNVSIVGTGIGYAFAGCGNLVGIYFQGNKPFLASDPSFLAPSAFRDDNSLTVYYLPGTTGWGPTFGGRPTVLWNAQIQTSAASFGVRQNRFGFNITGTADIPIVIEASRDLAAPSWVALQSSTLTNGLIYFNDPQWTNYPARFYRIRSP
jgi:hypothetical protein